MNVKKRKQGFGLNLRFTKRIWKLWDSMSFKQKEEYEKYYEDRENKLSEYKLSSPRYRQKY